MTEIDNQYLRGALVVTGRSASLAYGRSRSSGRPGGLDTPTVARSISRWSLESMPRWACSWSAPRVIRSPTELDLVHRMVECRASVIVAVQSVINRSKRRLSITQLRRRWPGEQAALQALPNRVGQKDKGDSKRVHGNGRLSLVRGNSDRQFEIEFSIGAWKRSRSRRSTDVLARNW